MVVVVSVSNLIIASVVLGLITSLFRYLASRARGKNYNFKGELVYDIFSSPVLISILVAFKSIVAYNSANPNSFIVEENMSNLEYYTFIFMLVYSSYILISYSSFKYVKTFKEAFSVLLQKFINLSYLLIIGIVIKLIVAAVKDEIGDDNNDR